MPLPISDKPDVPRILWRYVRDMLQTVRRQLRRLATHPRGVLGYARYRRAIRRGDWAAVRQMLRPLSQSALRTGDNRLLVELGHAAWRLDEPQLGAELLYAARAGGRTANDWRGENLPDDTLVVRVAQKASQGVAVGLDAVGYVRAAAARAGRTILIAEPRMVPLFQCTLPEVVVMPFGADLAPHLRGRAAETGVDDLKFLLGYDAGTIRRLHVPLRADPAKANALHERYRRGRSLPLIGISWWSSHYGKDLPSPAHWARLVAALPAQFVSLQYGNVAEEVAVLSGGDPQRLLVDPEVDQLKDMEAFADQIAALDLVITISNSGAHLAGALDRPMILVRDDLFRRNWPYLSREVAWYPHTTVIGKDGRPWEAAFDEIVATARDMLRADGNGT